MTTNPVQPPVSDTQPVVRVLAAIERVRKRLWALCYRMTGNRSEADDLSQEAIARAIERADQSTSDDPTGWILRLTTRVCLDHLRHRKIERRVSELVDPLDVPEMAAGEAQGSDPERTTILREDVRYAIIVALQRLTPRQRSAVILRDICDCPLSDVAETLELSENAAKALLQRARVALAEVRRRKPNFGRRAISRQWANGKRRLGQAVTAEVRRLNGESAIVIRLAAAPDVVVAIAHLETRGGYVVALKVNRDPRRIAYLGVPVN